MIVKYISQGVAPTTWTGMEPMRDDQWHLARLSPADPTVWFGAVLSELTVAGMEHRDEISGDAPDSVWQVVPDEGKKRIEGAIAALKRLTTVSDRRKAAEAAESLGKVYFFTGNEKDAIANLSRAIELAPQSTQAWEPLIGVLAKAERWKEAVPVARRYVGANDTMKSRLLLVKALDKSGEAKSTSDEVRTAARMYPKSLEFVLATTILDLRKAESNSALADIGTRLALLEVKVGKDSTPDRKDSLDLTRAILLGLQGKTEEAKTILETMKEKNAEDKAVLEALEALD